MAIFKDSSASLKMIKSRPLQKEKELQTLIEKNLLEVLELYMIASEYSTTFGGRIDTLAVDAAGCPVILEYKRNRNDNVINQALSYLKWLKSQKPEFFEMLIQKKLPKDLSDRIKLDWKNPRVICIAESYSKFDIDTVEIVPMRIELYKYKFYDQDILSLEPVNVVESREERSLEPSADIPAGDYSELVSKGSKEIQDLFFELRSQILEIDDSIEERVTALYVAYRMSKSFAEVHIGAKQIKVYLRPIEYGESTIPVEKISDGYNWTLNKRIYLKGISEIPAAIRLIEKSLDDVR